MKRLSHIIILLVLLLMSIFSTASAAGPTGTYVSGISCVNLESTAGSFTITFYGSDGSSAATISDSISANGSKLYFSPSISGLPDGFFGSAVVSSTVKMACAVNTQTNTGTLRVGTSNGVSSEDIGTKLYVTQIMNALGGSWSSYVAVQNAGSAAADVIAKYFDSSGTQVFSVTKSVPANSTHVFYQDGDEDANGSADLPSGFIGSATFESTASLAGIVAMYNSSASASTAQFLSYNAFTSGAMKVYAPRVVKDLSGQGFTSGVTCQNVGTASTDITMAFSIYNQATSSYVTATMSKTGVGPAQAWAIYLGSTGNATLDGIARGYGSIVITSSASNIACTINEDNRTTYAGLGSTYSAVPDGKQSTKMFFPQIVALGASSYRGGFQIANTTATAATCTYTFSNGDVVTGQALLGDGSLSIYAENVLINNKTSFNGSAVVECTQPIVGIYNLAALTIPGDSFATNNGMNQTP
jgi:hypothetical protein